MSDLIGFLLGLIASIPPAYDDYKDYLVNDLSWLLYPLFIAYIFFTYNTENFYLDVLVDFMLFVAISISFYLINRILGEEFGEADVILFFILIFYEPIINIGLGIPDYFIIIIVQNVIGILYVLYKYFLTKKIIKIPLVAMTPFSITTLFLLTILGI